MKPEVPLLSRTVARLSDVIRRLGELDLRQNTVHTVAGGAAPRVKYLGRLLRREMMALVRIATPELAYSPAEVALKVPHARASAQKVAEAAVAMAEALAPHTKLLKDAGYPREFLKVFRSRAKALSNWEQGAAKSRTERSLATREIAEALKEGMQAVTVIEGLVMRAYSDQPIMLRLWKNRRRVSKRIGRPKRRGGLPA
ncbi:MAG TPA: hypothetical protein VF483_07350 [Gemmatimonadaceae bacterium]